jgi:hypothetical protein
MKKAMEAGYLTYIGYIDLPTMACCRRVNEIKNEHGDIFLKM